MNVFSEYSRLVQHSKKYVETKLRTNCFKKFQDIRPIFCRWIQPIDQHGYWKQRSAGFFTPLVITDPLVSFVSKQNQQNKFCAINCTRLTNPKVLLSSNFYAVTGCHSQHRRNEVLQILRLQQTQDLLELLSGFKVLSMTGTVCTETLFTMSLSICHMQTRFAKIEREIIFNCVVTEQHTIHLKFLLPNLYTQFALI